GPPVRVGDRLLVAVQHRGSVELRAVPLFARDMPLAELPVVLGGRIAVRSFTADDRTVAAVVGDPGTPGDLVLTGPEGQDPVRVGDLAGDLRARGLARHAELTAVASDGYPVHGFL